MSPVVLQSAAVSGVYTELTITNSQTGEVRKLNQASNAITDMGSRMFGNPAAKWHDFNYCVLSREAISTQSLAWGQIIPSNSDPDNPIAQQLIASQPNPKFHNDIELMDNGARMVLTATKSWSFRQGIEGLFKTITSGHMEPTSEVIDPDTETLLPVEQLEDIDPVTGLKQYRNWKYYPISVAPVSGTQGNSDSIYLTAVDILTVTHKLQIYLPKYQPDIVIRDIKLSETDTVTFTARPFVKAYDALTVPDGVAITNMLYANASEMTGGVVSGLRYEVTEGNFDDPGYPILVENGDYFSSAQIESLEGIPEREIRHTLLLAELEGEGKISRFVIVGAWGWYEVVSNPPIAKTTFDKLTLNFYFSWS